MFVTAVCVLFLLKQKWPKPKKCSCQADASAAFTDETPSHWRLLLRLLKARGQYIVRKNCPRIKDGYEMFRGRECATRKIAEAERPRATSFPGFLILPPPGGGKMRDPGYEVAF